MLQQLHALLVMAGLEIIGSLEDRIKFPNFVLGIAQPRGQRLGRDRALVGNVSQRPQFLYCGQIEGGRAALVFCGRRITRGPPLKRLLHLGAQGQLLVGQVVLLAGIIL